MHGDQFLLFMGAVLLIGVAGNKFFHITRIPNSLILMVLGLILGPVTGWIKIPNLMHTASLTGTFALVLILFEGGLELEIKRVFSSLGKSVALGLGTFLLSGLAVFLLSMFALGLEPVHAFLLALILGGTSPAIILPVVREMNLSEDTRALVTLECTVSELCTVVGVLLAISTRQTAESVHGLVLVFKVLQHVVLAVVIAVVAGMAWGRISNWLSGASLSYMLTLSFICLLYSLVQAFGGDGALSVLFFGIVLANAEQLAGQLRSMFSPFFAMDPRFRSLRFEADEFLAKFNAELSFLVRTLFFILLGFLFDFRTWGKGLIPALIGISTCVILARVLVAKVFDRRLSKEHGLFSVTSPLFPRGLASASMALIAIQSGLFGEEPNSWTANFVLQLTFGTILFTSTAMAVALQFSRTKPVPKAQDVL